MLPSWRVKTLTQVKLNKCRCNGMVTYKSNLNKIKKDKTNIYKIFVLSFTRVGNALSREIASKFACTECTFSIAFSGNIHLDDWIWNAWAHANLILFIGASDKIIRLISSYVSSPSVDPSVVLMDESSQFVIPLLTRSDDENSILIKNISLFTKSILVDTSENFECLFNIEKWVHKNHLKIVNSSAIKTVQNTLRHGKPIGFTSFFSIKGNLPSVFVADNDVDAKIFVTYKAPFQGTDEWSDNTLFLVPDVSKDFIESAVATNSFFINFDKTDNIEEIVCGEYN